MKILTSEKGAVLMISFMMIILVTIYLSSYVIWTIWDQRNLLRRQRIEQANELARAGLNRVIQDLYLDGDSWLDGEIYGHNVTSPNAGNYTAFNTLYSETRENGNYTVDIRYLYDTSQAKFLDKRMWVRSTGTTSDAFRVLEQMVDLLVVRNLAPGPIIDQRYANVQPAVDEAIGGGDSGVIGITAATLSENVNINSTPAGQAFNVKGCYDPNFTTRSCSAYYTVIKGNLTIGGSANVTLSGVTIE